MTFLNVIKPYDKVITEQNQSQKPAQVTAVPNLAHLVAVHLQQGAPSFTDSYKWTPDSLFSREFWALHMMMEMQL